MGLETVACLGFRRPYWAVDAVLSFAAAGGGLSLAGWMTGGVVEAWLSFAAGCAAAWMMTVVVVVADFFLERRKTGRWAIIAYFHNL